MISVMQRLDRAGSWEVQVEELGRYLGVSKPVPDAVLRRARVDDYFATLVVLSRNSPDLLERLFNASATRAYERKAESHIAALTTGQALRQAAGSLLQWARRGFETIDDEAYEKRLETCRQCPHLVDAPDLTIYRLKFDKETDMRVCNLCGCVARRKARLASESCPAGRWAVSLERRHS